ncbi:hypothetical protein Ciccas_005042 [Cichlidogyrus casuarinus]|uniref:L-serine ammonia-lyase n=1 Tax=Cichlidogyrus casuarinus TaxID=1844966 RepID=A0ABD2QC29_9PLAT
MFSNNYPNDSFLDVFSAFTINESSKLNSTFDHMYSGNQNEDRSKTNLIINYLPQTFDQCDVLRLFELVGPVRQCKLIRDKASGASLCYGFVDYVFPHHAALAIQKFHGYETDHKRLRVAYASSGGKKLPPFHGEPTAAWELVISGLSTDQNEYNLHSLFSQFGRVLVVKLYNCTDTEHVSAVVIMQEKVHAEQVCEFLNQRNHCMSARLIGPITKETLTLLCASAKAGGEGGISTWSSQRHATEIKKSSTPTSCFLSSVLSQAASTASKSQVKVLLKLENVNPTSSHKYRGMSLFMRKLASLNVRRIVCPCVDANSAVSVAHWSQVLGIDLTIVMPQSLGDSMRLRRRIAAENANASMIVHPCGPSSFHDCLLRAKTLLHASGDGESPQSGHWLLNPYESVEIVEAYCEVVHEMVQQFGSLQPPDAIIVPVSSGLLVAGIIQGLKMNGWANTEVLAVELEGGETFSSAVKANALIGSVLNRGMGHRSTSTASSSGYGDSAVSSPSGLASSVPVSDLAIRLVQAHPISFHSISELECLEASNRFLSQFIQPNVVEWCSDDHFMLVDPIISGPVLSLVYSGVIGQLQAVGRLPRSAKVVALVAGGFSQQGANMSSSCNDCEVSSKINEYCEWSSTRASDLNHSATTVSSVVNSVLVGRDSAFDMFSSGDPAPINSLDSNNNLHKSVADNREPLLRSLGQGWQSAELLCKEDPCAEDY